MLGDEIARLLVTEDGIRTICGEHRPHIQEALASGVRTASSAKDP